MITSPEELIDRACIATGLSDFGPGGWRPGLDRLVEAARTDVELDAAATARLEVTIVGRLVNRLRIEDWYAGVGDGLPSVEGPVVIMGLPRTGTTALQYLLSVDPAFRFQRRWEISDPIPPVEAATEADDPRRLAAVRQAQTSGRVSAQHISSVDGPADDATILGLDFRNQELGLPLPTYTRWWRQSSLASTYAYHERFLRMLHSHRPPHRWLVKAPYHNFHLDELAAQYPNARFLMTHRDPAVAVASTCSTVATARREMLPSQPVDGPGLGAFLLEHLAEGIERAMRDRAAIGEDRFLDVTQAELEADAVATAERIYEFLGLALDARARTSMAAWAADNRRGTRGEHRYDAVEFGLTGEAIRAAFAAYTERFDLARSDVSAPAQGSK